MTQPRKLTGTEKSIQITRIILYSIGVFIGILLFLFAMEYFGLFEEFRQNLMELMNL